MNAPFFQLKGVSFDYKGGVHALCDINLTVHKGESIALCGPNGSGKTTFLKLVTGLLTPTRGSVHMAGEHMDNKKRKQAFRKVGFLFQDSEDQLFCSTVGEDVAYGPNNMELGEKKVAEQVQYALDVMKIAHLVNRPIHHLSGGEKKRVALAGLIAMQTEFMVLDEPTNGLEPYAAREFTHLLRTLNNEHGYTLITVTHEIDRIPEFAKRVIILKDGIIFRDGNVDKVLTDIPSLNESRLQAPIITQYFYRKNGNKSTKLPLTLDDALKAPSK